MKINENKMQNYREFGFENSRMMEYGLYFRSQEKILLFQKKIKNKNKKKS